MDFASMVSNIDMGNRYSHRPDVLDRTSVYRENQLARADAEGRRQEEEAAQSRSVFASAKKDVEAGVEEGPAVTAYMYSSAISEIKNLVRGGHLDKANERAQFLKQSADTYASTYRTYESSRPTSKFEEAVNMGGHAMAQYGFWNENVTMADGTQSTIGDMFRDGEAYKVYRQDSLLKTNLSEDFVETYKNSDPFKKRVFSMVADPVAKGLAGENVPQYSDVGNYIEREWDSMMSELGKNGVHRLVQDVVSKRIPHGTAIDVLNGVRDFVYAQTNGDGAGLDGDVLVRQYLSAYDRLESMATGGRAQASWQTKMALSKLLSAVAEGQKVGSNNINLEDPDVLRRLTDELKVFERAESKGISLLEEGVEGGENMRAALSDYAVGTTDSNFLRRTSSLFDLSENLVGSSVQAGGTVKNIVEGMSNEIAAAGVRKMSSGAREDVAIQSLFGDDESRSELENRWTNVIASNGGFSTRTAAYIAAKAIKSMMSGEGIRPADLGDILVTSSFDRDCPDSVKSELRRWYKGGNMVNGLMDKMYREEFMSLRMDKTIGWSMDPRQAEGAWAKVCADIVPYLETGRDPDRAMDQLLNSAPVYRPTGKVRLPNGLVIPEEQFLNLQRSVSAGRGTAEYKVSGGESYSVTADMLEAALPDIEYTGMAEYLPNAVIPGSRMLGVAQGFRPGAWRDSVGRLAFLRYQAMLKSVFQRNQASEAKRSDQANQRAAKNDASEPD